MSKAIFRNWLVGVAALFISANALAGVVYSSLAGAAGGWCLGGMYVASGFRTPTGTSYKLNSIRVRLQDFEGGYPFTFELYNNIGGVPGSVVASIGSGTGNGAGTYDLYTLTPSSPIPLAADTTYWIVAHSTGSYSCGLAWSDGVNPAGGIFTYVGERIDSGSGWNSVSSEYPQTEINATTSLGLASPTQIPTFSQSGLIILSCLLAFGAVFVLRRQRR